MEIKLQLSDIAYQRLIASEGRMPGSIALVSPTEGNFNEYRRSARTTGTKYIRLAHGRASVCQEHVRLTLNIAMNEDHVIPAQVIADESTQASDFVDRVIDGIWEYPYGVKK